VAKTALGIKCILTADAGYNWHFLGFEGEIEGQKLQAVDQVHLNKDGTIDQLIIYMRPISAAQKFTEGIIEDFSLRGRKQYDSVGFQHYSHADPHRAGRRGDGGGEVR
jgi:hypothetical protein